MSEARNAKDSAMRRRILVSGASGMIGKALIRELASDETALVRFVRRQSGDRSSDTKGESIVWDPSSSQPFPDLQALAGVETAIHLSGANVAARRWTAKYKNEIVTSRVQSTLALVNALTQLGPLPRVLVTASATGIYGDRGDEVLTEDSAPGNGFLAETCIAWEAATQAASDAGIRVINLRFGVVLSLEGGALTKLKSLFRLGLGGRLGDGHAWMPWVSLHDAVSILRFCVDNTEIHGPVNVVAPNAVTNAEFTKALGSALHRPTILPAPAFALRLAIGEMADQALLASARALPSRLIRAGYQFADPEIRHALVRLVETS